MESTMDELILTIIKDCQALEALAYAENNTTVQDTMGEIVQDMMWLYKDVVVDK